MKRIFYFLLICTVLVSCSDNNKKDSVDEFFYYQQWYQLVTLQNDLTMDPFNVAYQFNIYLNSNNETARKSLLKGMDYTVENTRYILNFTAHETDDDMVREGKLIIETHGYDLDSENSIWKITTDDGNPYVIKKEGFGWVEEKITNGEFTIMNTGEKSWSIEADAVYIRFLIESLFSEWFLKFSVKQSSGELDYNSLINGVEFEVETDPSSPTGGKTFYDTRFNYDIISPVLYSSKCSFLTKAGGKERLIKMDNYGIKGTDTVFYDMGTDLRCLPQYKITVLKDGEEISAIY